MGIGVTFSFSLASLISDGDGFCDGVAGNDGGGRSLLAFDDSADALVVSAALADACNVSASNLFAALLPFFNSSICALSNLSCLWRSSRSSLRRFRLLSLLAVNISNQSFRSFISFSCRSTCLPTSSSGAQTWSSRRLPPSFPKPLPSDNCVPFAFMVKAMSVVAVSPFDPWLALEASMLGRMTTDIRMLTFGTETLQIDTMVAKQIGSRRGGAYEVDPPAIECTLSKTMS